MRRRKVLFIAERFPPLGGPAALRVLQQVKHLPAHGFEPVVIAGAPGSRARALDPTLLGEVPSGTAVIRARTLPIQEAVWRLQGLLRRLGFDAAGLGKPLWPDEWLGWAVSAVVPGLRAARAHRPRVLYSTSGPISAHLAALIVQQLTGLPWVADFRDGWALHPGYPIRADSFAHPGLLPASLALERRVVESASHVTVACESIALVGLADDDPRRVVIRNGVYPDELPPVSRIERDRFRLAYVGSLYRGRDARPVLDALRDLVAGGEIDRRRLELRIVGEERGTSPELDGVPVRRTGHVDHRRALGEMADATALLFFQPEREPGVSSKIYEYLGSGRPVLAVARPDNRGYRLVQELGGGLCADVRDPAAIRTMLRAAFASWEQGTFGVEPAVRHEVIRRFCTRDLAGRLAETLRRAEGGEQAPGRRSSTTPGP